jgi:hypothetical protein
MLNEHFYHASIRRTIAAFGTIFNDIKIVRKDSAGEVKQISRVPLAYGPKQKFLARIDSQPDLTDQRVAIKLPRMSFEITGLTYDSTTKLPKMNKVTRQNTLGDYTTRNTLYTYAPYTMSIQLAIMVKNQDDGLQIVEQIIPYFQPDYTITINEVPDMNIKNDIPVVLSAVNLTEDYEGDFLTRRAIIYTLDFDLRVRFYGPIKEQKVIQLADVDMLEGAPDDFGFLEEYVADGTSADGNIDNVVEGKDETDDGAIT